MKEQDKIYVGIQDLGSGYATSVSITPQEGHSEYIRKDALLEWAKEKKNALFDDELTDVAAGINMGMDMLIGKLNSL